ncbi:MAG: tRNA (adenosine(37)-N6)-threonylcarbamoyltransferase complex ATPase subunit type 1 TsaE [bacterium]
MERQIFITKSAVETQKLAADIIKRLTGKKTGKNALVLALQGELGGGKTTFVQGMAKALGVKEKITSPTFVILRHFNILASRHFSNFYHIDCYRLDNPKDLADLGLGEILKDPENLVVIEWADKVKSLIPKGAVWVRFEWVSEEERKLTIS